DLVVHPPFEADLLQVFGDTPGALAPRHTQQGAVKVEQAVAGVVVGEAVVFWEVAHATAHAHGARRLVEQAGLPFGARGDAEQHLDQRRLAGAVLAEQPVDLAGFDAERDALERLDAAVALDQVLRFDDRHGGTPGGEGRYQKGSVAKLGYDVY